VEVDVSNLEVAIQYLLPPPRTRRGARGCSYEIVKRADNANYAKARAVLQQQAWVQEPTGKMEMPWEVQHLSSVGVTNGRLLLEMGYIYLTEPPPPPSFQSVLPGIGRGAKLLALLLPPLPPPYPVPPRVTKDQLPTAVVLPSMIPPPTPDLDYDDILQLEQLALDDNDWANYWWD